MVVVVPTTTTTTAHSSSQQRLHPKFEVHGQGYGHDQTKVTTTRDDLPRDMHSSSPV